MAHNTSPVSHRMDLTPCTDSFKVSSSPSCPLVVALLQTNHLTNQPLCFYKLWCLFFIIFLGCCSHLSTQSSQSFYSEICRFSVLFRRKGWETRLGDQNLVWVHTQKLRFNWICRLCPWIYPKAMHYHSPQWLWNGQVRFFFKPLFFLSLSFYFS